MSDFQDFIGRKETHHAVLTQEVQEKYQACFPHAKNNALIHFSLAQKLVGNDALASDGHPPKGGFLPPIPLPRRMWAGGSLTFYRKILVNDKIARHTEIKNIQEKSGKSGSLYFITLEHIIEANGEIALIEQQDIVYKGENSSPSNAPMPAPKGQFTRQMVVNPIVLFRYSALTFNAHRIHYDREYVREIEGYPALVVHGPLQATWLLQFACEILGKMPQSFSFKSSSPLFDTDKITLHATWEGECLKLWTAREGGGFAMQSEARA
jgi:3-methylfumaryl-CoA hydratase